MAVLSAADNQLSTLPESICELRGLRLLDVRDNQLHSLPSSMEHLQNLTTFSIKNNPLTENIHQLANQLQPSPLITYLLEIQKPQTQVLNEAKVLVLGDERVGKTSLIKRIQGRELDQNQQSTVGIDIVQHELSNQIKINIWDFAGQEITHQTHQFFLSHRSLYLLVLDGQTHDNAANISLWLNTIKTTAGAEAPIVVVVTKCDLSPGQFDRYKYQRDFNIVEVLYTSAADPQQLTATASRQVQHNISDVIAVIAEQVAKIDEVRLPFPPSWLAIKNSLQLQQNHNRDFIESAEYEQMCHQHCVSEPILQAALLAILNQIGTIVTYQDDNRLHNMQIINPLWVTNGVYKILRSPLLAESQATLNHAQFKTIFAADPKYAKPRHYTWLMDLLRQFRLAFGIGDQQILLPARLDTHQPDFELQRFRQGLNLRYRYPGLLKTSVISQFIVHMHEYITPKPIKYWRRGVFLTYGNGNEAAEAVVIADEEQKTITIAVDKSNRAGRELLTIIRHAMRTINGSTVEVEEEVLIVESGQVIGAQNYQELIEAEQEGDKDIRVGVKAGDKKSRLFPVTQLLDGYRLQDPTFDYDQLTRDLFDSCALLTESRHAIAQETEDQTNDRVKLMLLAKHYKLADQSRGGSSPTGKSAGERDMVIRNSQTDVVEAVIEAMVLKTHDARKITDHLTKLINNYDTTGNKYNYPKFSS